MFIVEKDPIVGWYFNESVYGEEISYEVNGNSEGGEIIILEEAVVYNGINLIVNYRENSCNDDEAYLFDIEDFTDSPVYPVNSNGSYKVCVAHRNKFLQTTSATGFSKQILSYDDQGLISVGNTSKYLVNIAILDMINPGWDIIISEDRPSNEYSCLGSLQNKTNSLFGDCDYAPNKIWINVVELSLPRDPLSINSTPGSCYDLLETPYNIVHNDELITLKTISCINLPQENDSKTNSSFWIYVQLLKDAFIFW